MSRLIPDFPARRIVLNLGALFSGASLARLLSALYIFLLARHLGVENFGIYIASFSLAKLTAVGFSLGLDSWLIRNASLRPEHIGRSIGSGLALQIAFGAAWLLLLAGAALWLDQATFPVRVLIAAALATWLEEAANFLWSAFKASLRNRVTVQLMVGTQLILLAVMVMMIAGGVQDVALFMGGRALGTGVALAVTLALVLRHFGIDFAPPAWKPALTETVPFALSHGLAAVYARADLTIIALWLGSTAAGLYGPAVSLGTTLFLIPLSLYEVMLPVLSARHGRGEALGAVIRRLSQVSMLIGAVLAVGTFLMAQPLVSFVYGADFRESADVLKILSAIVFFKCLSFAFAAVIVAVGLQSRRVWVQLVAAIFNIVVNLLVVEHFGIRGVAVVFVVTELLITAGYWQIVRRWQRNQRRPRAVVESSCRS